MFTRRAVTASAAAVALLALSVPVAQGQDDVPTTGGSAPGSVSLGSLDGGGPGADGSLAGGSIGSLDPGDERDSGDTDDSGSADDSSLGDLVPETDEVCELPSLGGSVAKFYPLFGIDGVPTGVLDLITSALDSFPNLLDVVAGEGRGSALIGEAGSLSEGLCSSIFGGEMVMPPVTVIVDGEGTPVTTVTGSATAGPGGFSSSAASSSSSTPGVSDSGDAGEGTDAGDEAGAAESELSTTVPVPGA